jgi:hypothetical protein
MPTNPQDKSVAWFRKMILDFQANSGFLKQQGIAKIMARPALGRLNHFWYDAKLKKELPYWDKFPLVVPLNYYEDGFLGINMHYLPPQARMAFFEDLMTYQSKKGFFDKVKTKLFGKGYDATQKLNVNYLLLRDTSSLNGPMKDCIKRYLYNHLKSPFLDIEPTYWEELIMLPTQRWQKGKPW